MIAQVSHALSRSSWATPTKGVNDGILENVVTYVQEQDPAKVEFARKMMSLLPENRRIEEPDDAAASLRKRERLMGTDGQLSGAHHSEIQQAEQANVLHHPIPIAPSRLYAKFLNDFVDPVHSQPHIGPLRTFVYAWLETLPPVRCRSDCCLARTKSITRRHTQSAPIMDQMSDSNRSLLPLPSLPQSPLGPTYSYQLEGEGSGFPTDQTPTAGARKHGSVHHADYRETNLRENGVYIRPLHSELPEHISSLVNIMGKDRKSPEPSPSEIRQDEDLNELFLGASEAEVKSYFREKLFLSKGSTSNLHLTEHGSMCKHAVPHSAVIQTLKISNPVPDILYGYKEHKPWLSAQKNLLLCMPGIVGNNGGSYLPFFAIDFKGDGRVGRGSLWVATNQCLGSSSACVNMAERFKSEILRRLGSQNSGDGEFSDTAAFSIAMSATEARLYVTWKEGAPPTPAYCMAPVRSFLLHRPEDYLELRKYVQNILEWGNGTRLTEIRASLDVVLKRSTNRAAGKAIQKRPAHGDLPGHRHKRQRSALSQGQSSDFVTAEEDQSSETNLPGWEWDDVAKRWLLTNANGKRIWAEEGAEMLVKEEQ